MNPILRNVLAVLVGATVCVILNGFLLGLMMNAIPPPEGFVPNDMSTYALLEAKHFLSPFVAHAVPSVVGGCIAALIAATRKMTFAMVVGGLHLVGGILAAFMIPAPTWFVILDLTMAYLPMAWIGGRLGSRGGR
ncbi:MAG: hypothetical protein JNL43_01080 [Flavobacteriales bacterium]|nr:hypothetical protein [Flavobacteriales bacterium]